MPQTKSTERGHLLCPKLVSNCCRSLCLSLCLVGISSLARPGRLKVAGNEARAQSHLSTGPVTDLIWRLISPGLTGKAEEDRKCVSTFTSAHSFQSRATKPLHPHHGNPNQWHPCPVTAGDAQVRRCTPQPSPVACPETSNPLPL